MKIKSAVLVLVVLLFANAPAYADNSRAFFLRSSVTVNGAVVPAGEYQLNWESRGSDVRVTLSKDGRFIATAKGTWVKHGVKYTGDAALLKVNPDGSRALVEIRIAGAKRTIMLSDSDPILRLSAN